MDIQQSKASESDPRKIIFDFLSDLKEGIQNLDPTVISDEKIRKSISISINDFLNNHFNNFNICLAQSEMNDNPINAAIIACKQNFNFVSIVKKLNIKTLFKKIGFYKYALHIYNRYIHANRNEITDTIRYFQNITDDKLYYLSDIIFKNNIEMINRASDDSKKILYSPNSNKCLIISTAYATTWDPMVESMSNRGYEISHVLYADVAESSGYGCLNTDEIKHGQVYIHGCLGAMIIAANMGNNPIMFCAESYHNVAWHAERCLVMYLILGSVVRAIVKNRKSFAKNLSLFMYDGLKPVILNSSKVNQELSKYYSSFMSAPDKLIYNSNSITFGDFIENTYGIVKPRLHFMRYSAKVENLCKRLSFGDNNDSFHIVTITASFDGSACYTRYNTSKMIKSILEQGIHFHAYTGECKKLINLFLETVHPKYRSFLHIHDVNRNQKELIAELHQYHAGFNGADHDPFNMATQQLVDRKYSDAMYVFHQATFPTSALVYAAAGLPIIMPRFTIECQKYFGKFCIPLCLSEYSGMKRYLNSIDLKRLCEESSELQQLAWIDDKIDQLLDFIQDKNILTKKNKFIENLVFKV